MPAINVARTDTFEVQRQKINAIGANLFQISQGGSDLSTGNLRLGDGTRSSPSLAFIDQNSLGIYRPAVNTIGIVSESKKLFDFSDQGIYSFKDLIVQRKVLTTLGTAVLNSGSNYDSGSYSGIVLKGGTGQGATADITVTEYVGTTLSSGANYNPGNYGPIDLIGGTGSGAQISFAVPFLEVSVTDAGTGYVAGTYNGVSLSNVTGSGAGGQVNVTIDGTIEISGTLTSGGSGYAQGTGSYSQISLVNTPTASYTVTAVANPGTPPPNSVYQINGVTQQTLTLVKGNTYKFDVSDSSMSGHPFTIEDAFGQVVDFNFYTIQQFGSAGTPGAEVYLTINTTAPTETIYYDCTSHDGMGAAISVVAGATGSYGTGAQASLTVNSSGEITSVSIDSSGPNYQQGDVLSVSPYDFGATGSGLQYTLNAPVYTGSISNVDVIETGTDYTQGDILTVSNTLIGGAGSDFELIVTSTPGQVIDPEFVEKGSGYAINDVLELPGIITGVTTDLKGEVTGVATTLNTGTTAITVSSTAGILPGMDVTGDISDVGLIAQGTTVQSVPNATTVVLSQVPDASGAASLTFRSQGLFNEFVVSDVTGISQGYEVNVTSGPGALPVCVVTNVNTDTNTITVSEQSTTAGAATLSFTPDFGVGTTAYQFQVDSLGAVEDIVIVEGGNGYSENDVLTIEDTDLSQAIEYTVTNKTLQTLTFVAPIADSVISVGDTVQIAPGAILGFTQTNVPSTTRTTVGPLSTTLSDLSPSITVSSTAGIVAGMFVQSGVGDAGGLSPQTLVQSVDSGTTLTLSEVPIVAGSANLTFLSDESGIFLGVASTSANGVNATFDVSRGSDGSVFSIINNTPGSLYQEGDTIVILGANVGGVTPTDNITLTVDQVTTTDGLGVYAVNSTGGFIDDILVDAAGFVNGDLLVKQGSTTPYTVNSAVDSFRFFIDTGSGAQISPPLTLYVGDTYRFNLSDSSNSGHEFSLSVFPDGVWSPSLVENVVATLDTVSTTLTIASTTGIVVGMEVVVVSGSGALVTGTTVESVDSATTLTLSNAPLSSGPSVLSFQGVEFTDGVTRNFDSLEIKVSETTPNLYYYCGTQTPEHANEGGLDGAESLITIDPNNTRQFGSGLQLSAAIVDSTDVISSDIETGDFTAIKVITTDLETATLEASLSIETPLAIIPSLTATTINSSALTVNANSTRFNSNFEVGTTFAITESTGALETNGEIKTFDRLNINEKLFIVNNTISTSPNTPLVLDPPIGQVVSIAANTALAIPAGSEADKPSTAYDGYIRFNTTTNQYEGFSETTSTWSSLGGVRDLDGNTTILAEETVGANDNTLWFINDNINSVRFTKTHQEFVNAKRIRSVNTSAPNYTTWIANTAVVAGSYLRHKSNVYEVMVSGATSGSADAPTDTSGNNFVNGTATLRYVTTSAAPLVFEEISLLRLAENVPLSVNNDLRLTTNTISSDISDITIKPFDEKKVVIDATSSLVLPVGDNNQKGAPIRGSVRYNTTDNQFEGFNGTQWGGLGGVKDIDQDTQIKAESAPGQDEDILYFFNGGDETLRVTGDQIEFNLIDTVVSSISDTLNIDVSTVTFDSLATTLDNSDVSTTFLSSTKTNLDFGLASGLNNDHLLRLTNTGEIIYNLGFGTGTDDNLTLLNNNLTTFDLKHVKVNTSRIELERGVFNSGNATVYSTATEASAKVQVTAFNTTTGDKELIEFYVVDNGTDVFFTDTNNIKTGVELISTEFDIDPSNNVRITVTSNSALTVGDNIDVTIVKTITKR